MASFAAQAAIRSKWTDLVESSSFDVPGEVSSGVRSVVGWLKQASLEVRQAGRRTLNTLSGNNMSSTITILHFNDVYNIEPRNEEPVGGAARFCSVLKSFEPLQPLILFSGDIFSPSMLSTFTKGEQMSVVLNECGVHCSVFGNHDFDFGLEVLSERVAETNFPWLMSNVIDNETGRPLGDGKITHVVDWNGKRIGLVGLVEQEWLDTLATINPDEVTFLDFVEAGRKLGAQLKQEGCDYVIALTHMRTPNDIKLAENVNEIDLILGGHDHVYEVQKVNDKYILKSGTDFRQLSKLTLKFGSSAGQDVEVQIEEVNVTSDIEEDPKLKQLLDKYSDIMEGKQQEVLGTFTVPLDGRFESVRRGESNLGNWVCDVVLAATGADLVMLNSGTFRSDRVHPAGPFTLGDLVNVVPMRDPLVVLAVTGKDVLAALENSVSAYPKLEGRFPQVAGVSFAFDPKLPPGQRVDPQFVRIGDEYLVMTQTYRLATKSYLHSGCDGYTMFKDAQVLVGEGECPELGLAIQNHFQAIKMRLGKTKRNSKHRQSLVTLSRRHSLVKMLDVGELDGPPPLRRASTTDTPPSHLHQHTTHSHPRLTRRASLDDLENDTCMLTPKVEQRIVILNDEFPRTEEDWLEIAAGFENKWQFPHCLGAIDGKHVRIIPPKGSGSYFYNYKKSHSVVLMAIANANCEFVYCDVGTNGRVSDGGVINNTRFHEKLLTNSLNIPGPRPLPNSKTVLDHVFVGDEAFAMHNHIIKPYPRETLDKDQRIFNYRLSRARRVVENTFGILASRFRIFHTAINLKLENIDTVVLACCALHNYLRKTSPQTYTPPMSMDRENFDECTIELGERCDPDSMHDLQRVTKGKIINSAKIVRDKFKEYFNTDGRVPWQDKFTTL